MSWTYIPEIDGAAKVHVTSYSDERGSMKRLYAVDEPGFQTHLGGAAHVNAVVVLGKGTLKGLHYQVQPSQEGKLVTCLSGSIFDVMLDTRPSSSTFGRWFGFLLDASSATSLFVPPGVAHGMQNLSLCSIVHYVHSDTYKPELERGVNARDPLVSIEWPLPPSNVSQRDEQLPSLEEAVGRYGS